MSKNKTKDSVAVVKDKNGNVYGYLTAKDEERGEDIKLAMQGYKVEAI